MKYSIDKLIKEYDSQSERLEYLFFWEHHVHNTITETCLSQWYPSEFTYKGIKYHNMEQYMMSEKAVLFNDLEIREQILNITSPKSIKALGRKVKNFDGRIWNEHKYRIVCTGNYEKFNQNQDLKDYLLGTGNIVIVEASPYDKIWGIGIKKDTLGIENPYNWKGQNLLGFALMEVRDIFN